MVLHVFLGLTVLEDLATAVSGAVEVKLVQVLHHEAIDLVGGLEYCAAKGTVFLVFEPLVDAALTREGLAGGTLLGLLHY